MIGLRHTLVTGAFAVGIVCAAVPAATSADINRSYTFNGADQLVEVKDAATTIARFTYDGDGERVTKAAGGRTVIFVRDPAGQVLAEYDADTGALIAEYVYANGSKVARISAGGTVRYYHNDHLGTPRAVSDPSGRVVWKGDTTPFGTACSSTGSRDDHYTFTGDEYDSELDLYYMHARYYSPEIGRFISADPIAGTPESMQSWNRYAYVDNNPLRYVDPTGRYKRDVHFHLTRYLALTAGIDPADAARLARTNQHVDEDLPAAKFWNRDDFTLHFIKLEDAVNLYAEAQTLDAQGAALHSVQDAFSHIGYGWPFGHFVDSTIGKDPDDTSRDVNRAMRMATVTFVLLGGNPKDLDRKFLTRVFSNSNWRQRNKVFKTASDNLSRNFRLRPSEKFSAASGRLRSGKFK